jgi:hypothetical protein
VGVAVEDRVALRRLVPTALAKRWSPGLRARTEVLCLLRCTSSRDESDLYTKTTDFVVAFLYLPNESETRILAGAAHD